MKNTVKISITTPCHENWGGMTPADSGRFCAACKKTVVDFTKSSDREIVNAYNKEAGLCGRFRASQLNRDLVIPKEKNSLWAGAAAAVAVLVLGTEEAVAQTPTQTEQHEIMGKMRIPDPGKRTITGTVVDENQQPLPGAKVVRFHYPSDATVESDIEGNFTIEAVKGDTLLVDATGYDTKEVVITDANTYPVQLVVEQLEIITLGFTNVKSDYVTGGGTVVNAEEFGKKRTFFERIFHSIGNIFR